jgi:hypothetical protein
MQSHLYCDEQVVIQSCTEDDMMGVEEYILPVYGIVYPRAPDTINSEFISPSGSQPVDVTSRSKSLNTKTSFQQTQQSACEWRSDLFPSSTWPTDPRRIVKAERLSFQFPPHFFFLTRQVKAPFEYLEVASSSS